MPPIASTKEVLDGLFNSVHRSVVVLIRSNSTNGDEVDFGTGSVVFSDTEKVLISIETSLINKDETIYVRFYDGSRRKARVFMKKTAFRHAVLEVNSRLQPPPVRFSESEVTRQEIFTVAAVHRNGAPGLMTGTVGNPNCKAINGKLIYRSESTFAMSCPAAGPAIIPKEEGIIKEPKEIAQLIGAAVFDMDGLVVGTVDTADPYSSKLKFAIKTGFFLDKLEALLKQKDHKISLLRGKGGLSKGTGTSRLSDTSSGSSSRKRGRANAPPSGTGTKKTVCISQVEGNVELLSEKQQRLAVRREAFERVLIRLVTEESDGTRRSSTSSFARNPGEVDDSENIIAIEPFDLNYFFGGDGKIKGYKSLKNGTTDQVEKIVKFLNEGQIASADVVDAVISLPYVFLPTAMDKLRPEIQVAAQNCWVKKGGAFTGEASAEMLANLGIPWVVLGHSERRSRLRGSSEFLGD